MDDIEQSEPAAPAVGIPVKRMVRQRDPHLDDLSDKVRLGVQISFLEALAVVIYQDHLRAEIETAARNTLFGRIRRWFHAA